MDYRKWTMDDGRIVYRLSPIVCRLILTLTLLFTAASPVLAEWYKDYESAMDLVKKGQFDAAVPKLRSSISQKPDEGSNIKFYGMKFADYFPHYYLGLCYFNTKDYPSALREFEQSEHYGVIQKKGELASKMTNLRTLAQAQLTANNPPVIAKNNPPPETVIQPVQQPQQQPVAVPVLTAQSPKKEPPANVPPLATASPPPVNIDVELGKRMARNGAQKYFDGDYDGAIVLLSDAVDANPNNAPSYFLLGCSYTAKYLLSGRQSQEDFRNAKDAFQKIKKIDAKYRLKNDSYFSPSVLEIYYKIS